MGDTLSGVYFTLSSTAIIKRQQIHKNWAEKQLKKWGGGEFLQTFLETNDFRNKSIFKELRDEWIEADGMYY